MPKGNPNPIQTKEFRNHQFKPVSTLPKEPLAKQPVSLKVEQSVWELIQTLPRKDRIEWLRRVIGDAARNELVNYQASRCSDSYRTEAP